MYPHADELRRTVRGRYLFLFSIILVLLTCSSAYGQSVVLYEGANYTGRSITLGIGEYRFFTPADFNDVISSITVPSGLVAVLYEHADEGGGYGISVDLLENCPDLSRYNFNDKVSFVRVFNAKRPGFFYARGSIQNGEFVHGHWEGARARGNPVNNVAVVSPPLPPHRTFTIATVMQVNGAQSTITTLGAQLPGEAILWEYAERDQLGVIGSDYRGIEEIGSAAFQRASNNRAIPDNINFWYPQRQRNDRRSVVYYKRTLGGTMRKVNRVHITGTYEDYDVAIHITPYDKYRYLITEGHPRQYTNIMEIQWRATGLNPFGERSGQPTCNDPRTVEEFNHVEAEIQPSRDLHGVTNGLLRDLILQRGGQGIFVYGPWIYDKGHCCHAEIHPAEQIWWNSDVGGNKKYHLNVFADASGRFWWRDQMDDGTKLRPWGAPPIKGTFAIAFAVRINPLHNNPTLKYEVTNIDYANVAEVPDGDRPYNLVYQNRTLVSFVPNNSAFKVSFEKVGLRPGTTNIIQGFLVLETTVGSVTQVATTIREPILGSHSLRFRTLNFPLGSDPDKIPQAYERRVFKKVEGHYMFSVLRTETHTGTTIIR